jgi:hypothetical protein
VDCGPDHFSAMTASPPGGPTTSEGVAASLLRSPACTLAIDLMGSHAIRGRPPPPPPPPPPPGGGGRTEAAALAVWGYGEGCATIDAAVMRTLGAFRRNNFGIVDLLHSPVGEGMVVAVGRAGVGVPAVLHPPPLPPPGGASSPPSPSSSSSVAVAVTQSPTPALPTATACTQARR